jgi:hypothetical protein
MLLGDKAAAVALVLAAFTLGGGDAQGAKIQSCEYTCL